MLIPNQTKLSIVIYLKIIIFELINFIVCDWAREIVSRKSGLNELKYNCHEYFFQKFNRNVVCAFNTVTYVGANFPGDVFSRISSRSYAINRRR